MKKILLLVALFMLHLTSLAQPLCVIDGLLVTDSILSVTSDEMRSDSAKQVVAKRLGWFSCHAIDTIFVLDKDVLSKVNRCCQGNDIVIIRTNSFAKFNWVVDGKLTKPRREMSIVEFKLLRPVLTAAFPRELRIENIKKISVLCAVDDVRPEARPTILITTKAFKRHRK